MKLQIFDKEFKVNDIEELRKHLKFRYKEKYGTFWLEADNGESLAIFINGMNACMFYIKEIDDSGLSSLNQIRADNFEETMEFIIDNYQMDEYPLAMVIPITKALEEFEGFFKTGKLPRIITWNE
jgi:hypothetical protein